MEKIVRVEIKDLKIARSMLEVAGYYEARKMADEEVFNTVLHMIECYGAEWNSIDLTDI